MNKKIHLSELIVIFWKKKLSISVITLIFAISSVFYSLSIPNIYMSSTVLAPSYEQDSLSSTLSSFSSLASFTGVQLPAGESNKSQEAIARIRSLAFFKNHFLPYINLEDLFAVKNWSPETKKIEYNNKIFNEKNKKWVRSVKPYQSIIPSDQEAYKIFTKNVLSLSEDRKTSYITLSIKHKSPIIAKEWNELIIKMINESMRTEDMNTASTSITYLNEKYETTNIQSLKEAISKLLESQLQTLMLSSTNQNYIFKVIDAPVIPEEKIAPNRALICILITFIGGFFAILFALIRTVINKKTILSLFDS